MTEASMQSRSKRRAWMIGVVALALIGGGAGLFASFKYDLFPKRFGVVVPGEIYRSGQLSERMLKPTLESHNIKTVIDFQGAKEHDAEMDNEARVCKELGIDHHRLPLAGDGTGRIERYAEAIAIVVQSQRAHKPVLLHCSAGTQRTGAATAFYRLLVEHKSPEEAYRELSKYDWNAKRDAILVEYMNAHMAELAKMLVERGAIEKVPEPLPVIGAPSK